MGDKDIVSKEIIKEIGRDISMHILGIDIQGEVILVDKEWTRVENYTPAVENYTPAVKSPLFYPKT
jgi:hypothetical protein